MRSRVVRVQPYCAKVYSCRLIELPFLIINIAYIALGPCMEETVSRGNAVFPERFIRPTLFRISISQIEMGLSEIRIKSEGSQVFCDSLVNPPLFEISHSKAGVASCFPRAFQCSIVPQEKRIFPYGISRKRCKCERGNQHKKNN